MARSTADFAERNSERAVQATNFGMDWVRDVAEQHIQQSKMAADTFLTLTRRAGNVLNEQALTIRERSMATAEASISNAFDFLRKLARMKDPHELVQIQSEFISEQAHVIADQTKVFGQTLMKGAHDITKTTLASEEERRKRAEAA